MELTACPGYVPPGKCFTRVTTRADTSFFFPCLVKDGSVCICGDGGGQLYQVRYTVAAHGQKIPTTSFAFGTCLDVAIALTPQAYDPRQNGGGVGKHIKRETPVTEGTAQLFDVEVTKLPMFCQEPLAGRICSFFFLFLFCPFLSSFLSLIIF